MANVFNKIGDIRNSVKRNSFDWSHDNNFTTDLGRITPVFTELVPPNSSIRIKPEFGLRFMPMMFPVQTKMKAYLSFYKVPLRTLWKDYMDFISSDNSQEFQPPFISFNNDDYKDGGCLTPSGLGDYFSIPTNNTVKQFPVNKVAATLISDDPNAYNVVQNSWYNPVSPVFFTPMPSSLESLYDSGGNINRNLGSAGGAFFSIGGTNADFANRYVKTRVTFSLTVRPGSDGDLAFQKGLSFVMATFTSVPSNNKSCPFFEETLQYYSLATNTLTRTVNAADNLVIYTGVYVREVQLGPTGTHPDTTGRYVVPLFPACQQLVNSGVNSTFKMGFRVDSSETFTSSSGTHPYYGAGETDDDKIKISAYPFRAYEAIYNAYIRNTRNNPFVLDGKKTYNRWISNDAGGSDIITPKHLRYANWQSDAYTTALQSPQQGVAPLVGLTTYESVSFNDAGHTVTTINTAIVDEEGNAYKVDFESNGEALKGVNYTPLKSGEAINMQSLVSPVTSGISINDFRNVNAYQRYLELNQFRGFSYKEIIEGRFDVNVRYDALNMPEYLGGITRDVIVNPITQTVETSNTGSYAGTLGSQSGLATCFGNSDGSVSVFCDEESIIMGIMYVMPMPVYDTLLPKYLTYRERLDSFNPEFDHIGYQPIYARELAAVQCAQDGVDPMTVFGYQRPWYEYVQKPDRAHGLFLSSLRNFIMFRSFSNVPELGSEFTVMQPGSVNNVFMVTEVSDKILGQIHFDCTAQLPISRVVVPRLE